MPSQNGFWTEMCRLIQVLWTVAIFRPGFRGDFFRLIRFTWRTNPGAMNPAICLSVLYLHLGPFAQKVAATLEDRIAIETGATPDDLEAMSNALKNPRGQRLVVEE